MGWFGSAFVFTEEPDWGKIAAIYPPAISLYGYRHKSQPIWLLGAPEREVKGLYPFVVMQATTFMPAAPSPTPDALAAVKTLEAISALMPKESNAFGGELLIPAAVISRAIQGDCFIFMADDEFCNMACVARNGTLEKFSIAYECCSIDYVNGKFQVAPTTRTGDEYEDGDTEDLRLAPDVLSHLKKLPNVEVASPDDSENEMYSNAVKLWPMGSPQELLGIGTWDVFRNFEKDFTVVFERRSAAAPLDASNDPALRAAAEKLIDEVLNESPPETKKGRIASVWIFALCVVFLALVVIGAFQCMNSTPPQTKQAASEPPVKSSVSRSVKKPTQIEDLVGKKFALQLTTTGGGEQWVVGVSFQADGTLSYFPRSEGTAIPPMTMTRWRIESDGLVLLGNNGDAKLLMRRMGGILGWQCQTASGQNYLLAWLPR